MPDDVDDGEIIIYFSTVSYSIEKAAMRNLLNDV